MQLLKLPNVMSKTGLGRSSIYEKMADGTFPRSVPLGGRSVAWVSDEVDAWILERIEARDAQEVAHV